MEKAITLTCTSMSVFRNEARGAPLQEATPSENLAGLSGSGKCASITLTSLRQAPPPR